MGDREKEEEKGVNGERGGKEKERKASEEKELVVTVSTLHTTTLVPHGYLGCQEQPRAQS